MKDYNTAAIEKAPIAKGEIDSVCSRLESNMEQLMKSISILTNRIQPVLCEKMEGKGTGKDLPSMGCQLGERLQSLVNSIEGLDESVTDLVDRVRL